MVAALAPRERRCPACGAAQSGGGRRCTNCGADLTARFSRGGSRRAWVFAAVVAAVLAAVSIPVVGALRDDAADERARAAERQRQITAAERVRQERAAVPVRATAPAAPAGVDPIEHRAALVRFGEDQITADANRRVAEGTLKGDHKGTRCELFPETDARRAAERDPATRVGRYDCVAYTSQLEGYTENQALFGDPFWLVVDYERGKLVWCKITPRAGEGGSVLVSVPVPEPCRDPAGPG